MEDLVEVGSTTGTHDVELIHRLELADAWVELLAGDDAVRIAAVIDGWPGGDIARPLAWIAARVAAGERPARWEIGTGHRWLDLLRDGEPLDPRLALVDAIALDHDAVTAAQLPRVLRVAPRIAELSLIAVDGAPTLFAAPWPRLAKLRVETCAADCERIVAAELPALTTLTVRGAPDLVARLGGARWLAQLAWLELDAGDAALLALARHPMPRLRHVKLGAITDAVRDAWRDPVLRPALAIIEHELDS